MAALIPGAVLCLAITVLAMLLQAGEVWLVGEPYLEALVLAILCGVLIRALWPPDDRFEPGIQFSAKTLLEIAIVLLGASISAGMVADLGLGLIIGIASVVVMALVASYLICRLLGLDQRTAILIACGNSICGNSAIAAVAPVISARSQDVASAIAFTAVLGVVVVLLLPLSAPLLWLNEAQYGTLAGLTVYAVPQVLAATLPVGALSSQIGTVVKLVRVLMLGPVVLCLTLLAPRLRTAQGEEAVLAPSGSERRLPPFFQLIPWFILGFLAMAAIRSAGLVPPAAIAPIASVAGVLTTISMAALGLGVDVRAIAGAGLRVTGAVTLSLSVLCALSYGLVLLAGV